jgi:ABC-type lipoprotein release transport system permease subunit
MTDLSLLLFLALRGLLRSRLTTAMLVAAVAAGVGLQIPNTANLVGYTGSIFEEATTSGFGNVRVQHARDAALGDADDLAAALARELPAVRAAVPIFTLPGAVGRAGRHQVAEVHGVDPTSAYKPYRIRDGRDLAPDDEGVLVGTSLAARLGIAVGDDVEVRALIPPPSTAPPPEEGGPQATMVEYTMKVRGTCAGTFGAYESLVVTRALLGRAMARPHAATRILLYTGSRSAGVSTARQKAPLEARSIASDVERSHPDLHAVTWMTDHPYADSAIRANEVLGVVSHTMVVVAVTIPILSLLFVTVQARSRDIAMLSALGFTRADVFVAFVLQSLVVGVAGAAIGCALGAGAIRWFSRHPIFSSDDFVVLPVATASTFYEPAVVVLLATVVAAAIPAYRATRLAPARVLRGLA